MKELILERLGKIEDLEQRRMLKQLMSGLFLNLVDYQEQMSRQLEQRVFDEIEDWEGRCDIYVSLCSRDEWDPIHEFLYPMRPEDLENTAIDISSIVEGLRDQREARLTSLFLECDSMRIKGLIESGRQFGGQIKTAAGAYRIKVELRPCDKYLQEIENLYHVFLKNGLPWRTINHPFAYKFVDIVLTGCEGTPDLKDIVTEISVDLEEYEAFKRTDRIPLWNIERLYIKNSGFPVPASDRVNFEHVLSLRKTGTEHGYLVDGHAADIRYIKRSEEELTIVSPQERAGIWSVLKVVQPVDIQIGRLEYPLVSNRCTESFVGKYTRKQAMVVRSKGEIARIVHSLEASEYLVLEDTRVIEDPGREVSARRSGTEAQTYEMNPFISDQVRAAIGRAVLRLSFRPGKTFGRDDFMRNDFMSFVVSEVQMYLPEYKCEGVWV
ncbi:normocyte-binding protein [Paenibacillus sp. FJAT-26967]|uniref:normocyte-binding protein n=1 Tax=Paenibacillus sp. FJAT-26967 TaxID=1729690 RepID=UPI000839253F|nr:normocyte-binding protein [Paenibacillus sp. FJAT-26967]